jgi:hypothetical protein
MGRARHKVELPVTQGCHGLGYREDVFDGEIETLRLAEAEFDRCYGRKIGVGNQVRNGDLHGEPPSHTKSATL